MYSCIRVILLLSLCYCCVLCFCCISKDEFPIERTDTQNKKIHKKIDLRIAILPYFLCYCIIPVVMATLPSTCTSTYFPSPPIPFTCIHLYPSSLSPCTQILSTESYLSCLPLLPAPLTDCFLPATLHLLPTLQLVPDPSPPPPHLPTWPLQAYPHSIPAKWFVSLPDVLPGRCFYGCLSV